MIALLIVIANYVEPNLNAQSAMED